MNQEGFNISVCAFLIALSMYLVGGVAKEYYIRRDAVKANVAYWTVDENGI